MLMYFSVRRFADSRYHNKFPREMLIENLAQKSKVFLDLEFEIWNLE